MSSRTRSRGTPTSFTLNSCIRRSRLAFVLTAMVAALIPISGCSDDPVVGPEVGVEVVPSAATSTAPTVGDLSISSATASTLTARWTQIDDGTGRAASYRLKYSAPPIAYASATTACTIYGGTIGARASCTISNLPAGRDYELQLRSFRIANGHWQDVRASNTATGRTETALANGIWISPAEIAGLPTSGEPWRAVRDAAAQSCGKVDLAEPLQYTNVCILAKALVYARTGKGSYAWDVYHTIKDIAYGGTYDGTSLSLGRQLAAYVIAADIIDLRTFSPSVDSKFRSTLRTLLTTYASGGGAVSLTDCNELRPNNWGTHCGASRAAVAAYLGDAAELARVAKVFRGFLGDRSTYRSFRYGSLSWQCDPTRPVGINPRGCSYDGHDIDGVIPDDQRRSGSFRWPPPKENYAWEALQGALVQAVILERAGYPVFQWENQALKRAAQWLYNRADYAAEGDDSWQAYLFNHYYGTSFQSRVPSRPGKNMGWTDWTHP